MRRYHACLLLGALLWALFNLLALHSAWGWLFILATPLLVKQARYVMREPIRWRCGQCSKRR
jgi:1,4-dihydroxy-2-naphthoate octaprenyltransferase